MKPQHWLLIFVGIFTLAGASFTLGRMSKSYVYVEVPAHEYADFHVSSVTNTLTPMRDTTDLEAVKGTQGQHEDHIILLGDISFYSYSWATDWTVYIQTGGHVPDTTVFVKYQGKAVCVSKAVELLMVKKLLR